ncbi:MAG: hypothetical protein KDA31_01075 [Phycisphaerales bacterium]|nr:hypothetical protein [Phycisphaerales bacterium]MCB9836985.1 hypothetical protein [Phycisphaera sp.]
MSLQKRRAAAKKYQPKKVRLLLVAEAPPCDTDRYFYFEDVDRHDWLFRYVWEGLAGDKPERDQKREHLNALKRMSVFLIDLHEENVSQPTLAMLAPKVPGLIKRCQSLKPDRIVLIKSVVHDAAYPALVVAGLPVADARIPFPASGQQKKFLTHFRGAVADLDLAVGSMSR